MCDVSLGLFISVAAATASGEERFSKRLQSELDASEARHRQEVAAVRAEVCSLPVCMCRVRVWALV